MVEVIQNKRAVAASNVLMNGSILATNWIVTTNTNGREVSGGIQINKWEEGMIPVRERIRSPEFNKRYK